MTKTQAMIVGSRPNLRKIIDNPSEAPCFAIGDTNIDIVQSTKYLGIILDQHLAWDEHITLLQAGISRALSFLKYAKKFLLLKVLNLIYKGVVEPHFRYCCSVWGNCGESKKNALQKLQHRAARIVTNSSYDAFASPLLSKLEWPTIDEIIKGETTNMVYKSINNLAPKYLCNLFTKDSSRDAITLRNSELDLYVPFMNIKNPQKLFSYPGVHFWNGLKSTTKMCHLCSLSKES